MFNNGMFQFNQKNNAQDAEFVQQENTTPRKPINFGKGLKVIPLIFLGIFAAFTLLNSVYSLEEDEYAVIKTWGYVQVEETPGIKFKIPYIQNVQKVSKASKQVSVGYDIDT